MERRVGWKEKKNVERRIEWKENENAEGEALIKGEKTRREGLDGRRIKTLKEG